MKYPYGQHFTVAGGTSELTIEPDASILIGDSPELIVDAKYKLVAQGNAFQSIARSDVYEATAYLEATGCSRAILVYPRDSDSATPCPGSASVFEHVRIGSKELLGVHLELSGISTTGGYRQFVQNFGSSIAGFLPF
jgi:5-methylcytosine-specific restriction endonuclease McrBC regulatory subunit McrC